MKKLFSVFVCMILSILICGCSANDTAAREDVTVNLPKDTSVNGYRITSSQEASQTTSKPSSQTSSASQNTESSVSSIQSGSNEPQNIQYCANTNSKIFHLPDCGSVKNTKEENKLFLSDRDELINLGYSPCKRCNP